jgi:DNA-binding transcriptional LysR family regulator
MMDLTRLTTLREFATRGTVAATALALGYSPSAVSQQLSTLEHEAGVALTERSGRRLRLTPAGERLVARVGTVLGELEAAEAELRSGEGALAGTVRLALFQSAALSLVPAALRLVAVEHPELRVVVTQSEPGAALADTWVRGFDLVVAEEYPHHSAPHYPGIDRRPLVSDELRLCVGGMWSDAASLRDVAGAAWVMEPPGTATRHFAEQVCRTAGFEPDVRFETADLQAHVRYIEAGLAVGLLPGLMWGQGEADLYARSLTPSASRTVFTASRLTSQHDPAIAAVRSALERAALDLKPAAGAQPTVAGPKARALPAE